MCVREADEWCRQRPGLNFQGARADAPAPDLDSEVLRYRARSILKRAHAK
jgi:hypothetical protein